MSTGIIELNDAGLRVGSTDAVEVVHESPGIAVLDGDNLLLGVAARAQNRLHPLQSNALFWHRLNTEPLPFQNSHCRHHADLAYSQLLALHQSIPQREDIIFSLPATYTREQLALLLGIVEACPFRAVALVDSAVAASAAYVRHNKAVHLDVQLHQCVLTDLERDDGYVRGQRTEVLPGLGVLGVWDRWAKTIADQFIEQCRFDPLHSALSEQSLYDQLPQWLASYQEHDELVMEVSGKSIKLSRAAFVQAVMPFYEQIKARSTQLGGSDYQLLVSDRLAALPGLCDLLRKDRELDVDTLPAEAVIHGIQQHATSITQDGALHFNRVLPTSKPADNPGDDATTVAATPAATFAKEAAMQQAALHLLIGHQAWPVTDTLYLNMKQSRVVAAADAADCRLTAQDDGVWLSPLGSATDIQEQLLRPGDTVNAISLIEVLQGHGTP